MNYKQVKKKTLLESAICGGIIIIFAIGIYFFDDFNDNYDKETTALEGEVNTATSNTNAYRDIYTKAKKYNAFYQMEIQKFLKGDFTISRQVLRDHFEDYKLRYHLNDVKLTMSTVEDLGAKYKHNSMVTNFSNVTLQFSALSDEDVYHLLADMQDNLPGSIKVVTFNLDKASPLTSDMLNNIAKHGFANLVKGETNIEWLGLHVMEPEENNTAAKKP